jgi:hypothetical protein
MISQTAAIEENPNKDYYFIYAVYRLCIYRNYVVLWQTAVCPKTT